MPRRAVVDDEFQRERALSRTTEQLLLPRSNDAMNKLVVVEQNFSTCETEMPYGYAVTCAEFR